MANSIIMNNMQNDMLKEFSEFQKDPAAYLLSKGLNIPQDKLSNPEEAVGYIISSGQGTNEQLNQFKTMLSMFHRQ